MNTKSSKEQTASIPHEVDIHYSGSSQHRVVHVDGCVGGPSPKGLVSAGFFSEPRGVPRVVRYSVNRDGTLGDIVSMESTEDVRRELEITALMTPDIARSVDLVNTSGRCRTIHSTRERQQHKRT